WQVSGVVEECVRVKAIVAVLPIAATMKLFGAAFGNQGNLPARAAAILGLVAVGQDLELGDGIETDCDVQSAIVTGVDVSNAINGELILGRARPVHREIVGSIGTSDGVITAVCKLNAGN